MVLRKSLRERERFPSGHISFFLLDLQMIRYTDSLFFFSKSIKKRKIYAILSEKKERKKIIPAVVKFPHKTLSHVVKVKTKEIRPMMPVTREKGAYRVVDIMIPILVSGYRSRPASVVTPTHTLSVRGETHVSRRVLFGLHGYTFVERLCSEIGGWSARFSAVRGL